MACCENVLPRSILLYVFNGGSQTIMPTVEVPLAYFAEMEASIEVRL